MLDEAMAGVGQVIHLAGRAHHLRDAAADPDAAYRAANVEYSKVVADAAVRAGVRHLVFASSVKAVGEHSLRRWTEAEPPAPADPYGLSKLEAELLLQALRAPSFRVTVLRLPLVYGDGMRANMLRLYRSVDRGMPLPFGAIHNERSILYLDNLTAALAAALADPSRVDGLYFLADGPPVSTPQLVRLIAKGLGRPARLIPVPVQAFVAAGAVVEAIASLGWTLPGRRADFVRLIGSLAVDSSAFSRATGFRMPYTSEEGLRRTAEWYRRTRP